MAPQRGPSGFRSSVGTMLMVHATFALADLEDGDDFSNDLFSDLAPILALFGERVTMQFLSQATGWADCIILAMAPLGIVTIIISAIRVGGPSWLKAIVGRARENLVSAELELMSSTSQEACELWNGKTVVRCQGSAPVWEFVCVSRNSADASEAESMAIRVMSLEDAIGKGIMKQKTKDSLPKAGKSWLGNPSLSSFFRAKGASDEEKTDPSHETASIEQGLERLADDAPKENELVVVRNLRQAAPNISLNSHANVRRTELYLVATFGVLLQLAVLTYDACIVYHPSLQFEKGDAPVERHAFPLMACGTLLLVLGVFVCGHVVESSTVEERYEVADTSAMNAQIVWLQQQNTVSDQFFGSFAMFSREPRTEFSTSSRVSEPESVSIKKHLSSWAPSPLASISTTQQLSSPVSEIKAVSGSFIGLCGFVIQFTALRSMHWSASVANLGAILLMTALRAFVRRKLVDSLEAEQLRDRFELDWLSQTLSRLQGPRSLLPKLLEVSKLPPKGQDCASSAHDSSHAVDRWTICTWQNEMHLEDAVPEQTKDAVPRQTMNAHGVMMARRDLACLADWRGPAAAEAIRLAQAIEITMNALLPNPTKSRHVTWSTRVARGSPMREEIKFRLYWSNGSWNAHADELEAALSLWLYSAKGREQSAYSAVVRQSAGDDFWLRGRDPRPKMALRMLGPYEAGLIQDLRWWMPDGLVGLVRAEERSNPSVVDRSSLREVESLRIAGSGHAGWRKGGVTGDAHNAPDLLSLSEPSWWHLEVPWENQVADEPLEAAVPERAPSRGYIATTSNDSLENLYAKDMLSAFLWAVAEVEDVAEYDKAVIRPGEATGLNAWKSFTLRSERLTRLAHDIESTGLTSLDEAFHALIPPLGVHGKLPSVDNIAEMAQAHGMAHEKLLQWREASETYCWLFEVAQAYCPDTFIYRKALAILLSFRNRLRRLCQISDADFGDVYATGEMREKEHVLDNVLNAADAEALQSLRGWPSVAGPDVLVSLQTVKDDIEVELGDDDDDSWGGAFETAGVTGCVSSLRLTVDNLEARDIYDTRPLHHAACKLNEGLIRMLREADTDSEDDGGYGQRLAAFHASANGMVQRWTAAHSKAALDPDESVKELLERGADPNVCDVHGWTPLHYACLFPYDDNLEQDKVKALISKRARADAETVDGLTPLHCAAMSGHTGLVEPLLDEGANIDATDCLKLTPLLYAAHHGHLEMFTVLIEKGADPDKVDLYKRSTAHLAARSGHFDLIDFGKGQAQDTLGWTPLHQAAFHGQLIVVGRLWQKDEERYAVHHRDRDGRNILHLAARNGHSRVAAFLKSKGADESHADKRGHQPLGTACKHGHADTVRLLISLAEGKLYGETVESLLCGRLGHWISPPLLAAANAGHAEVMLILIEAARKKSVLEEMLELSQMGSGAPLLDTISATGTAAVVDVLVRTAPDAAALSTSGHTRLIRAARANNEHTTGKLLELGADPLRSDSSGLTPLEHAVVVGHSKVLSTSLDFLAAHGRLSKVDLGSLIHRAASHNDLETIRVLIRHGADIEAKDSHGRTPLRKAAAVGNPITTLMLLRLGAEVDSADKAGRTALFSAAGSSLPGSLRCLETLLEYKCDVRLVDTATGETALHASTPASVPARIMSLLIESGADVCARDFRGTTPLHRVALSFNVAKAKLLMRHGASVRHLDNEGRSALRVALPQSTLHGTETNMIQFLIRCDPGQLRQRDQEGCIIAHVAAEYASPWALGIILQCRPEASGAMEKDAQGRTPLHYASESEHPEKVIILLSFGASIDSADDNGATALMLAVYNGNEPLVNALLFAKADVNARDIHDRSPLHIAVDFEGYDLAGSALLRRATTDRAASVSALMKYGADLEARDGLGRTPLMLAVEKGVEAIVDDLLKRGADTSVRDQQGRSLLELALERGDEDIITALST